MKLAPLGVFGLIGVTVSKFGLASLIPLGKLIITVYGAMFFFVFFVLGFIAKMAGTSIISLMKLLKDELILVYYSKFWSRFTKTYGKDGGVWLS